jgi:cbb3-type cytochrome oxidase maturation protein
MEILVVLIPVSVILIGIAAVIFLWAVNNDQFEQLDKHGFDIFEEDSGDEK